MPTAALHLRSHFSLLRSAWSVDAMARDLAAAGYASAALTDHASIAGAVEFWQACRAHGVRPILGCELPVRHLGRAGTVLVLVENTTGYHHLCRLLTRTTRAFTPGLADLQGRVDGLIVTTSGEDGWMHRTLRDGNRHDARKMLEALVRIFGPDHTRGQLFFQRPGDTVRATRLAEVAAECDIPCLIAPEARYAAPEDARLLSALTSIGTLTLEAEAHPEKPADPTGFHLRPAARLAARPGQWWPEAAAETDRIAARCQLALFDERLSGR